ncbi:zinc-binding dehydrogenase domain-containing protein [Sarocladium implicatum]|nr:zinc-binding dehydrogenase domain-containing protein [Sarocladium implicatum]
MGVDFTYYKGSPSGDIVEATGHRDPKPTEVIIKITHCGLCGTDEHVVHSDAGLGHEGIGIITEVGSKVHDLSDFRVGDRVERENKCPNATFYAFYDTDQGTFGTAIARDISALWKIPENLASEDAGPLMCGGSTVWQPLYESGLKPGDRVGIIGIGGLGHLGIQFAAKLGLEVVVFSSTESKKEQAMAFGAKEFYATKNPDELAKIKKLDILLITTNNNPDLRLYIPLLEKGSRLYPLTISTEDLGVSPLDIISNAVTIVGTTTASVGGTRDMLAFAAEHDVKPLIEKFPMTQSGVTEAMQKLRNGKMRYRGVLVVPDVAE